MSNNAANSFKVLRCETCEEKWHSATLWRYFLYALPDGRKISVDKTWAWCDDCRSFEAVECLPTHYKITTSIRAAKAGIAKVTSRLQNAEKKLAKAALKPPSVLARWMSSLSRLILKQHPPTEKDILAMREDIRFKQRALDDLLVRKDFLAVRMAPAKCLTCGGSKISYVDLPEISSLGTETTPPMVATRHTHRGCGGKLWLAVAEKTQITTAGGMQLYDHNGSRIVRETAQPEGKTNKAPANTGLKKGVA